MLAPASDSLLAESDAPWRQMLASKEMVQTYLVQVARELTDRASADFSSRKHWETIKEQRRVELLDMLGLNPLPRRTPLRVQVTGTIEKPGYTIEKLAFESLPKIYATANLYVPKSRTSRLPAIVYVCGHSVSPHGSKVQYQHHAITFAKHGYVCLIIDPIQIAETFALHHGVYNLEMPEWYALGYTPAGVEVWNVIRALDYLETRPEVDPERLGITGRSGGAAMSWFSAAVDSRLKVAVPVMGNSTYAANVAANTQKRHCDCMFPINIHQHDLMTQGALIAPRPLHMMHGKQDELFPVPGYEEFAAKIGKLYRDYGSEAQFKNTVVDTGHKDSDYLREEAVHWFDRYLKNVERRVIDLRADLEEPENLSVFKSSPPADALNFQVHELLTAPQARANVRGEKEWRDRKNELLERLRQSVFAASRYSKGDLGLAVAQAPQNGGFREMAFFSEPGIRLRALYRGPDSGVNPPRPALIYAASDGEDLDSIRRTLVQVLGGQHGVMIVYPRGAGEVPWNKETYRDMQRNAMHVGRTVDSMRLWDVLRSLELLKRQPGVDLHRVTLIGRGVSGALGLYAAILDESVAQVMLINPPVSHRQGPIFLNILRYTDLPEAAALLAPRRLIFFGSIPEEFATTQSIYQQLGFAERLSLSMSVRAVLDGKYDHQFSSGY
jgi:cephalosporin-C deacetylase-like acetyl esterase